MTTSLSLGQRVLRSSAFTILGYGTSIVIRLGSNLILTRLLFPEAFGLMALVTVFLTGLHMLSDLGIGQAVMQSPRGDDPTFLDTAWTLAVLRGFVIWLIALASTPFFAWAYDEPQLQTMLPVATLSFLIASCTPTRVFTADRHLKAGLLTMLDLASQILSVVITILLALAMRSVWALVIGVLAGSIVRYALLFTFLPGHRNRLRWDREAGAELIGFGKWIILSSFCGFLLGQADKIVLGYFLDLAEFGLYNIAWTLATLPLALGAAVMGRLLIPVYRESPPDLSLENAARVRRMKATALTALLVLSAMLAFGGGPLVRLLYDPRYYEAGDLVILLAVMQGPALLLMTCDQASLAAGDSRRFFIYNLIRMVLVFAGLLVGWSAGGLVGAILGQGLATLATYPVLVWLLRPISAWTPGLDAIALGAGAALGVVAVLMNDPGLVVGQR